MKTRTPRHSSTPQPAHRQRGVYAIEYALVFLIFFGLIYALICYSILFTFRFALQNAAEDGARAALRYQVNLEAREARARGVAEDRTGGWLPAAAGLTVTTRIDQAGAVCGPTWDARCQIVVTVTASNLNQVLPPFPNFALPSTIAGQASVLLDGRAL